MKLTTKKTDLSRVLTLLTLTLVAYIPASAQWNTDGTPVCIYEDATNTWGNFNVVQTADKKFWLTWTKARIAGNRPVINGIERNSCATYLQLLDSNGRFQFESPLLVNNHITNTYITGNGLQTAIDGSAIITVCDGRTEEEGIADDTKKATTFTPAIYKIDQQGNSLWGTDGIAYTDYTNVGLTNSTILGNDTYFSFNETGNSDNPSKTFYQCISDDGTVAWKNLKSWNDENTQLQLLPVNSQQLMLFEAADEGSMVHLLNGDFEEMWDKAVTYTDKKYGGYVPTSYQLAVDGQGGAFSAFVYNTGGFTHNIRVQHILNDGSLAFGATGKDFGKISYDENHQITEDYDYPHLAVNTDSKEIMLLCKSKVNGNIHVALQKFTYDGETLFGDIGLSLDSKESTSGYNFSVFSVKPLNGGDWIVVYTDNTTYNKLAIVIKRLDANGNTVWAKNIGDYYVSKLQHLIDNDASYIFFYDKGSIKGVKMLRIFHNGSFENKPTAISEVTQPTTSGNQYFTLDGRQTQSARQGLNIVRSADGNPHKIIVK